MHPPLNVDKSPLCAEKIIAFKKCTEECGYFERMLGSCNEQKQVLDACFKSQKKVLRKEHKNEARAARERWKQACLEMEAPVNASS